MKHSIGALPNVANEAVHDSSLYDYDLPQEMIAQRPADPRDSSRLLVLHRDSGAIEHRAFSDIGTFLRAGDLLVLNNTRVLPARTYGTRHTGGKIEVFFLRDLGEGRCEVLLRCGGSPRPGEFIRIEGVELSVRLLEQGDAGQWRVSLPRGSNFHQILERVGRMPLPPYIKRDRNLPPDQADIERYQTVFASRTGAVAAPTAGLHFTEALLDRLRAGGVETCEITLHVGAGTFRPIKEDDIRRHRMHGESYTIDAATAEAVQRTRDSGGRVVAVGTTSCRALEAVAARPEGFGPAEGWTDLYITPPYEFRITDVLQTNFHLPRSTLLVLVAAFAGRDRVLAAYEEAKRQGYRFYSYGDAMLIL